MVSNLRSVLLIRRLHLIKHEESAVTFSLAVPRLRRGSVKCPTGSMLESTADKSDSCLHQCLRRGANPEKQSSASKKKEARIKRSEESQRCPGSNWTVLQTTL